MEFIGKNRGGLRLRFENRKACKSDCSDQMPKVGCGDRTSTVVVARWWLAASLDAILLIGATLFPATG